MELIVLTYSKLTAKNFLSIGNVTQAFSLNSAGMTLILGSNTDTQGAVMRNAAGKTTMLQAITYVLYGVPLTKIK